MKTTRSCRKSSSYSGIQNVVTRATLATTLVSLSSPTSAAEADNLLTKINQAYVNLISISSEPEASALFMEIGSGPNATPKQSIDLYKVPYYRVFTNPHSNIRWYAVGVVSHMDLAEEGDLEWWSPGTTIETHYRADTGLAEVGVLWPLAGDSFALSMGTGLGLSRISNKTQVSDPNLNALFQQLLGGYAINWSSSARLARASAGLHFNPQFENFSVKSRIHYITTQVTSFNHSEGFLGFSAHADTINAALDVLSPLPWSIAGEPVGLLTHIGSLKFVGPNTDVLGYSQISEAGVSLVYKGLALGTQYVFGDNISGVSLSVGYGY